MRADLQALLARYPPFLSPTSLIEPLGHAGGFSGSRFWKLDTSAGPHLLHAWPLDGPSPARLTRVHAWLASARLLDCVPQPVFTREGTTFLPQAGRLWQVEPWMPGHAEGQSPPPRARLESAFSALACFHQAMAVNRLPQPAPSPGLLARLEELGRLDARPLGSLHEVLANQPDHPWTPAARDYLSLARQAIPAAIPRLTPLALLDVPLQPCLRDARPEHILFTADRVTGLLDFGAMDQESVAADLARLMDAWLAGDLTARSLALQAYESIRPLEPTENRLITAFSLSAATLTPARWIRWAFIERRVFDDPAAAFTRFVASVDRLRQSLRNNTLSPQIP